MWVERHTTCLPSKSYWIRFLILAKPQTTILFYTKYHYRWGRYTLRCYEASLCPAFLKWRTEAPPPPPFPWMCLHFWGSHRGDRASICAAFPSPCLDLCLPCMLRTHSVPNGHTCVPLTQWPCVVLRTLTAMWDRNPASSSSSVSFQVLASLAFSRPRFPHLWSEEIESGDRIYLCRDSVWNKKCPQPPLEQLRSEAP